MPVWYILTLGIYRRIWLYRVNKELDGHAALGINHRLNVLLLILPIIGPTIVTYQTTRRCNADLHSGAELQYGPTPLLWLGTFLLPIIGPAAHMVWTQDRLNKYWQYEKANPDHGIDVDQGLSKDKKFVAELKKAREASMEAGSRFDRAKEHRREKWRRATADLREARKERALVRAAGGSTPVLPWRRPERPRLHLLHVTCGRCEQGFDVHRDPVAETPVLCPKCGLREVLPSLRGDPLKQLQPGALSSLEVDCPKCDTHFHALRDLYGPTQIQCYNCGHQETLPAPKAEDVQRALEQQVEA